MLFDPPGKNMSFHWVSEKKKEEKRRKGEGKVGEKGKEGRAKEKGSKGI